MSIICVLPLEPRQVNKMQCTRTHLKHYFLVSYKQKYEKLDTEFQQRRALPWRDLSTIASQMTATRLFVQHFIQPYSKHVSKLCVIGPV